MFELRRVPGPPRQHPLPGEGWQAAVRPSPQWIRPGPPAHGCRDHRQLSAGGRHHPSTCGAADLHGRTRRHAVSGALPETERERQVRQLAGRLLAWPDPEGPQEVDLIPVGYPEDFPPELVDLTELRFLGSVVRRRAGALVGVEMVFEGPGEPPTVVSNYEAACSGSDGSASNSRNRRVVGASTFTGSDR